MPSRSRVFIPCAFVAACVSPLGPETVELAGAEHRAQQLAVGGGHAYWISENDASLRRVPVSGGPVERLATDVHACAVDGAEVYCTTTPNPPSSGDVVVRMRSGSPPEVLPDSLLSSQGVRLVIDGDSLIGVSYRFREAAVLFSLKKSGGPVKTLYVAAEPGPLAIDATHVYFAPRDVLRVPKMGGAAELVFRAERGLLYRRPDALAVAGDRVVFVAALDRWPSVWSIPKTGGALAEIARMHQVGEGSSGGQPRALVADTDRVWFTTDEGELWWVPASGSGSPVRASDYRTPNYGGYLLEPSIALDDRHVCWTSVWGAVLSVAR